MQGAYLPRFWPSYGGVGDFLGSHPYFLDELRPLLTGVEGESIAIEKHKGHDMLIVHASREVNRPIVWRLYHLRNSNGPTGGA